MAIRWRKNYFWLHSARFPFPRYQTQDSWCHLYLSQRRLENAGSRRFARTQLPCSPLPAKGGDDLFGLFRLPLPEPEQGAQKALRDAKMKVKTYVSSWAWRSSFNRYCGLTTVVWVTVPPASGGATTVVWVIPPGGAGAPPLPLPLLAPVWIP